MTINPILKMITIVNYNVLNLKVKRRNAKKEKNYKNRKNNKMLKD